MAVAACAQPSQYYWGNYSQALYNFYEDPTRRTDYQIALADLVEEAGTDKRVPPGIFAEIGFMELQDGNAETARQYFERERAAWPESAVLMDRMIAAIDAPPQASAPSSASTDNAPVGSTAKPGS